MWRHAESIILGFLCFFLPLFLVLWFLKLVIGIGDETFGWVGKLIFQREIYGFGLVLLLEMKIFFPKEREHCLQKYL